jgi:hypothetical protein
MQIVTAGHKRSMPDTAGSALADWARDRGSHRIATTEIGVIELRPPAGQKMVLIDPGVRTTIGAELVRHTIVVAASRAGVPAILGRDRRR